VREVSNAKSQEEGRVAQLEAEVAAMQENATNIANEMAGLRATLSAKKKEVLAMQQLQRDLESKGMDSDRVNKGTLRARH
jgi:hypothetical protein